MMLTCNGQIYVSTWLHHSAKYLVKHYSRCFYEGD